MGSSAKQHPSNQLLPAKQDRSVDTRERLLRAAIDCFSKFGVGATNTTIISEAAGVTRGAYLHHFKLVAAAVALMVEDAMGQIETGIKALFQTERSSTVFIDIWKKAYPDTFFAGYEMMLLARHDPELKREWLYQSKRFAIRRKEVLMNLFPADVAVNEAYPFLEAVADFFRGMKVMEVVRTEEESRAVIKSIGRLFDAELTRIAKLRIS
ncbi:TetR family transcriptional regulator [Hyphobacterium sp.]|uniref:TetR family transcriptional regulator n=1 Tax=Hyphobacterium sp. TaxID=2004662 RepID=UPI00374A1E1D